MASKHRRFLAPENLPKVQRLETRWEDVQKIRLGRDPSQGSVRIRSSQDCFENSYSLPFSSARKEKPATILAHSEFEDRRGPMMFCFCFKVRRYSI